MQVKELLPYYLLHRQIRRPLPTAGGVRQRKSVVLERATGPDSLFQSPAWHCRQRWKPAETVSAMGPLPWRSMAFAASTEAQATFLKGSEDYVRQCHPGAGSPPKRSGPWGSAVAQRGFRGFARALQAAFL